MSIENPHTTGLFEELLAGATAVKERPTLIAERDSAKAEAAHLNDIIADYRRHFDEQKAKIDELTAALAAREADLAHATFQHSELGSKLSLVASVLKDVMGNATAAMELVEPPKAPEPEPTTVEGEKVPDPDPMDLPGTFTHTEGFDIDRDGTGSSIDNPTASPEGQSAVGPTAPSMDEPSLVAPLAIGSSSADNPAEPSTVAYSPKPYWEKPSGTDWLTWAKAGHGTAPWVTFTWDEQQELNEMHRKAS